MKKVKKETAPRRDRRKERTEYLQSLRAQLLARVQQLDVLLLTLGVRESNHGSPACETYPTATDLFGRRF